MPPRVPVVPAALLAALVLRDRVHDERGVAALAAAAEAAARDERAQPGGAREGAALAVRDARVEIERRAFGLDGEPERLARADAAHLGIEGVEVRERVLRGQERRIRRAGERVRLAQAGELDRVEGEPLEPRLAHVARVGHGDLLAEHHAQADRARPGLLDQLRLLHPDLRRQVRALADRRLRDVGAGAHGAGDDLVAKRLELFDAF